VRAAAAGGTRIEDDPGHPPAGGDGRGVSELRLLADLLLVPSGHPGPRSTSRVAITRVKRRWRSARNLKISREFRPGPSVVCYGWRETQGNGPAICPAACPRDEPLLRVRRVPSTPRLRRFDRGVGLTPVGPTESLRSYVCGLDSSDPRSIKTPAD
jgi:hypothetical protein